MPAPAEEALTRCFINLYSRDKAWLYRRYGHGWSEQVRRLVRRHIKDSDAVQTIDMNLLGVKHEP